MVFVLCILSDEAFMFVPSFLIISMTVLKL